MPFWESRELPIDSCLLFSENASLNIAILAYGSRQAININYAKLILPTCIVGILAVFAKIVTPPRSTCSIGLPSVRL